MRIKKLLGNIFRQIQMNCKDFTHWNSQEWWLTLFCNGDIFHNHESVNTLQIKYQENRPRARWEQDAKILCKFKLHNAAHLIS